MSENKLYVWYGYEVHTIYSWHEKRAKEKPMGNDIGDKSKDSSFSSKKCQVEQEKIPSR